MCNRNCTCSQNEFESPKQEHKVGEDYSSAQEWKKPLQSSGRGDHQYSVLVGVKNNNAEPTWKTWGTLISDRHVLTKASPIGCNDVYLVRACYNRDYEVMNVSRVAGDSALCILTLRDSALPLASTAPPVFNPSMATCGQTSDQRPERDSGSYPNPTCDGRSSHIAPLPTLTQEYSGAWSQSEKSHRGRTRSRSHSPPCEHLVTEYPPQFRNPPGNYCGSKCGNFEVGGLGSGQALLASQPVRDYAVYTTKRHVSAEKQPSGGAPLHGRSKSPMASFHHQFVSSLRQYPNVNPKIASFFPEALELLKNLPPINNGSWQNEGRPMRPATSYQRPQWANRGSRRVSSAGTQHRKPESEEKLTRCMDYEKTKFPQVSYQAAAAQTNVLTATKQTGCRPRSVAERTQRTNVPVPQRAVNPAAANSTNSRRCSSNSSCVSSPVYSALAPPTIANCLQHSYRGAWGSQRRRQSTVNSPSPPAESIVATEYPPQYHEPPTGHGRAKVSNFEVGGLGSGPPLVVGSSLYDYALYTPKHTSSANRSKSQGVDNCVCPPAGSQAGQGGARTGYLHRDGSRQSATAHQQSPGSGVDKCVCSPAGSQTGQGGARTGQPHQNGSRQSAAAHQQSPSSDGCKNPMAWFEQQFLSGLKKCPLLLPEQAARIPQGMDFITKMENMNKDTWRCGHAHKPMSPCANRRPQCGAQGTSSNAYQHRKPESEEKITRCMDYEKMRYPQCSNHATSTQNMSNPTAARNPPDAQPFINGPYREQLRM